MNHDLISREDLKKAISNLVVGGEEKLKDYYENGSKLDENAWIGGIYDVWELIEDAPTVEVYTEEQVKELIELNKKLSEARPQGKWVFKHSSSDIWCSICDENFDEIPQKFNYCPNCGADMRKGGTE